MEGNIESLSLPALAFTTGGMNLDNTMVKSPVRSSSSLSSRNYGRASVKDTAASFSERTYYSSKPVVITKHLPPEGK
jgi:hypothetical protein